MPKVDYKKLYHDLLRETLQVSNSQDEDARPSAKCVPHSMEIIKEGQIDISMNSYKEKIKYFYDSKVYAYAFTVSPKSSPVLKSKNIERQYTLISNIIKSVLSKHNCNFWFSFEFYKDNENLHTHGFLTVKYVKDLITIKKELKEAFNFQDKLKKSKFDSLTKITESGYDADSKARWSKYCLKELRHALTNNLNPIYSIDLNNVMYVPKMNKTPTRTIHLSGDEILHIVKKYDPKNLISLDEILLSDNEEYEEEEQPEEHKHISCLCKDCITK